MQNPSNHCFQLRETSVARLCAQLANLQRSFLDDIEHTLSTSYHAGPGYSLPDLAPVTGQAAPAVSKVPLPVQVLEMVPLQATEVALREDRTVPFNKAALGTRKLPNLKHRRNALMPRQHRLLLKFFSSPNRITQTKPES